MDFIKYHAINFGKILLTVSIFMTLMYGTFGAGVYVGQLLYPMLGFGSAILAFILICLIFYVAFETYYWINTRSKESSS